MRSFHKIFLISTLLILINSVSVGQVKNIYKDMSLDEILNVDVVVTASKKPEDLFEAPLSTTIIKKEEILRSGASSIPEALRLAPGVIVREVTPGNFDVHIRGYDGITKNAYLTLPINTNTLVMIDNRIVYSYFTGGTFWETIPIEINDVERIEIVRGPASALYGPNAVSGVINIITSHANKKGINAFINGNIINKFAKNINATIGYNWNDKTKLSISGNFAERRRFNTDYFDYTTQSYTSIDDHQNVLMGVEKDINTHEDWTFKDYQSALGAWYDEDLSLRKTAGNIFFNHHFSEQSAIDIALGAQKSQSQKTGFLNFATPLSQIESESYYADTRINYKNLSAQFNIRTGDYLSNYKFNSFKFTDIDANLEYYKQFKKISIRPGISYKQATYNSPITYDEPFSMATLNYQFKDEPRTIVSYAASLLSEWKPIPKLRIIGALRTDKFNVNDNLSFNYEIASTYRINKNNLVRYVLSKANRSPFIFDSYLNCNFNMNIDYVWKPEMASINVPVNLNIKAAKNLKFPRIHSHEIGWRTKINNDLDIDIGLFYSHVDNFIVSNAYREGNTVQHLNQIGDVDSVLSIIGKTQLIFENFDIKAEQYGAEFTITYNPSDKINSKFFGTYQKTNLYGRTEVENILTGTHFGEIKEDNTRTMDVFSFISSTQWSKKLTPSFYGGFYLNYQHSYHWNFSTDAYIYTKQRFIDYDYNNLLSDYSGVYNNYYMDIKSNIILNAKASYLINKKIMMYITLKNILGNHREFGYADQIGRFYQIGIQWNY